MDDGSQPATKQDLADLQDDLVETVPGVSTFPTGVCTVMPRPREMPVFVIAPSQAPSGASENSPGRKPCGTSPGMLQPRKKALRAWGLTTPPDKALSPLRGSLRYAFAPTAYAE